MRRLALLKKCARWAAVRLSCISSGIAKAQCVAAKKSRANSTQVIPGVSTSSAGHCRLDQYQWSGWKVPIPNSHLEPVLYSRQLLGIAAWKQVLENGIFFFETPRIVGGKELLSPGSVVRTSSQCSTSGKVLQSALVS